MQRIEPRLQRCDDRAPFLRRSANRSSAFSPAIKHSAHCVRIGRIHCDAKSPARPPSRGSVIVVASTKSGCSATIASRLGLSGAPTCGLILPPAECRNTSCRPQACLRAPARKCFGQDSARASRFVALQRESPRCCPNHRSPLSLRVQATHHSQARYCCAPRTDARRCAGASNGNRAPQSPSATSRDILAADSKAFSRKIKKPRE